MKNQLVEEKPANSKPTKRQKRNLFFEFIKAILRIFYRKPKIINLAGELPDKCVFLSNHAAKNGPMALELYFPKSTVKWGAHEMLGNYRSRKSYLKDVYYIQKRHIKPFWAGIFARFEAIFSPLFYKIMNFIGTYRDARFKKTLELSVEKLAENRPIMIFPEDSSEGYFDVVKGFIPGFVLLVTAYKRRTGEDLPVYPVYYSRKKGLIIIGQPDFVDKMLEGGASRQEIADCFCEKVNDLYYRLVCPNDENVKEVN